MAIFGFFGVIFQFIAKKILPFVLQYWKQILVVVVIGVVAWQLHHKTTIINEQKITINQLQSDLATEVRKANNYLATVEDQNKKIEAAAKKTKDDQKALDDLAVDLAKKKAANDALINKIRTQPLPTDCLSRDKFMKDNLENVIKW